MASTSGAPSAADVKLIMDNLGSILRAGVTYIGLGNPAELSATTPSTIAALAAQFSKRVVGDGSANYGLANTSLKSAMSGYAAKIAAAANAPSIMAGLVSDVMQGLDTQVRTYAPSGWSFSSNDGRRPLDLWLSRINAVGASVPTAPTAALALTPAVGGALNSCLAANAPLFVYTWVSSSGDYLESLPSPVFTQVALTGAYSAYTCTLPAFPTGVKAARFYRTYDSTGYGGSAPTSSCAFYHVGDFTSTAVTLTTADSALNVGWTPPSYLSCMMGPEQAFVFALGYYTSNAGSGLSLLAPDNVSLAPATRFLGMGNPSSGAVLWLWSAGSGAAGTYPTSNTAATGIQGFAGVSCLTGETGDLRARVTSALGATATLSVTYTYTTSSSPLSTSSATISGVSLASALGSTATFSVPKGRLVKAVTALTVSGTSSGQIVIEGVDVRSL